MDNNEVVLLELKNRGIERRDRVNCSTASWFDVRDIIRAS
jgi:hypothetical protein